MKLLLKISPKTEEIQIFSYRSDILDDLKHRLYEAHIPFLYDAGVNSQNACLVIVKIYRQQLKVCLQNTCNLAYAYSRDLPDIIKEL